MLSLRACVVMLMFILCNRLCMDIWILVRTKAKYKLLCGQILINHFSFWCLLMWTSLCRHPSSSISCFFALQYVFVHELMNLAWGLFWGFWEFKFHAFMHEAFIDFLVHLLQLDLNQAPGQMFLTIFPISTRFCHSTFYMPPREKLSSIFFFPFK